MLRILPLVITWKVALSIFLLSHYGFVLRSQKTVNICCANRTCNCCFFWNHSLKLVCFFYFNAYFFFGTILWIGEFSILFLLFYFISIRVIFLYDIKENNHRECTRKVPFFSLRVPIILYLSLAPLLLRQ